MASSAVRKLLPYVHRYRRAFGTGLVCVIATTAFQLLSPWVLKYAIDDLHQAVTRDKLLFYAALMLGVSLMRGTVPVPDAADHHRRVARHRVRHP